MADVTNCWVSIAEVSDLAGATVTDAQVTVAQAMIEGLINRVYRSTDADGRDYYWLKRAVAWQSRHVAAHPEMLDQVDVSSLSQDGFSVVFRDASTGGVRPAYSQVAVSFLNNMRQGANTSLRVNSAFQGSGRRRGARWSHGVLPSWRGTA